MTTVEKRGGDRRAPEDRRAADRRAGADRRVAQVEVEVDRRVGGRRFVERRNEVRRQLNDRRHLLT